MSLNVKNNNQGINKINNKLINVATSSVFCSIAAKSSNLEYDINQVDEYDNIDDFLDFIENNNLSIFSPNESYFTIFHILIQASRLTDFNKIANYVKKNKNAYKNEFNYLKKTLKSVMENDADELDHEILTTVYSNLEKTVVLNGFFDQEEDKEVIENIKFISNHLRLVISDVLKSLFKE